MFRGRVFKKFAEYQNEQLANYLKEVENIHSQMRLWRHDYHNHLQTIKACIAMGKIEELSEFCGMLEQDLRNLDLFVRTGHVMLDAIVNSKLSLANSRNIDIIVKATVPEKPVISDVDLCSLIGNLIDNALEACAKTDDTEVFEFEKPFIRVYIGTKGHMLYICITNSSFGKPKKQGNYFLSAKRGFKTFGFGGSRIDRICRKYGGYNTLSSEPGVFTAEVLLPAVKK